MQNCTSHEYQYIPLTCSKILRTSEQRHKKVLSNLKTAEAKAAQLCRQQSETRKKLFSLYASLQTALASSSDESATRASRQKTDNVPFHRSEIKISDLSWWRISVLDAFHVGNMTDYSRHLTLRMEVASAQVDVDSSSHLDIVVPICQHHLLGTCLDEKCVLKHLSTSKDLSLKSSSEKSRGLHFSWILKRHHQHLSTDAGTKECGDRVTASKLKYPLLDCGDKKCVDFYNKHLYNDYLAASSQDQISKKKETAVRYFDATNTNHFSTIDESTKSSLIAESASDSRQWRVSFMDQASVAAGHLGVDVDLTPADTLSSTSTTSFSSSFAKASSTPNQRISLGHFMFELLYGCGYRNEVQRNLCLLSCMQILKGHIDCSHSTIPKSVWRTYLILCLECNIVNMNPTLLFWPKMIRYLEGSFSGSRSVTLLLTAGRCRLKHLNAEYQSVCPAVVGDLNERVCRIDVIESVRALENMCREGRGDRAIDLLSARVDLESLCSTDRPADLSLVERLPIGLAFAMLFNVLFTGECYGRKVLYSRDLFFMEKQVSNTAVRRVKNFFRRSPHIVTHLRDAFKLCFSTVPSFHQIWHVPWQSKNFLKGHVVLTVVDQNILWSYLILMHSCSAADVVLMPLEFSDILIYCDPLCYPGVYEGVGVATEGYAKLGILNPCDSMRVDLFVVLNAYLSCKDESLVLLEAAVQRVGAHLVDISALHNTSSSASSAVDDAYLCDAQEVACESWTSSYLRADDTTQCRILLEASKWTIRFSDILLECDDINAQVQSWSASFVLRCGAQLKRLKAEVKETDRSSPGHNIVFLNILCLQVLTAAKAACVFSARYSTCVSVLEMVASVTRASLRLNDPYGDCFRATGHDVTSRASMDGIEKGEEEEDEDDDLHCCVSETDCASPTWQHRLLERTLDLLHQLNMITYDIVEYLFSKSMVRLGGLDMLVKWVLHWFYARETPSDSSSVGGSRRSTRRTLDPTFRPSLKSSALLANIFQNNKYLSSRAFLSRISSPSLLELGLHFLNAESFELYSTVQGLLDLEPTFAALLKSYTASDGLIQSVQLCQSALDTGSSSSSNGSSSSSSGSGVSSKVYVLVEDLNDNDDDSGASDSMLQRFQENLNDYHLNKKTVIDFSSLIPHQMTGCFPFQSLALFSQNVLELDLSNNFLKYFPAALLFFLRIRKLNISANQIERLPSQLSALGDLRTLDLSSNKLTAFPPCLLEMKGLEVLILSSNSIEYMPTQVKNLQKLRHLDISLNPLRVLCSDLTHIRFLKTV
jgi:Leucine-rich repeat (LRR) protein